MWITFQSVDCRPRLDGVPSLGEPDGSSREETLKVHPVGSQVRGEFADGMGHAKAFTGVINDFNKLYWRVRYPDGDWEELNGQNVKKKEATPLLTRSLVPQIENAAVVQLRVRVGKEGHRIETGLTGQKGGL